MSNGLYKRRNKPARPDLRKNLLKLWPWFCGITLLGVATLYNHSVPPVDVSIAGELDFFRQLLEPNVAFPLPFRISPVKGSIGAGQLWSSGHPHFPGRNK